MQERTPIAPKYPPRCDHFKVSNANEQERCLYLELFFFFNEIVWKTLYKIIQKWAIGAISLQASNYATKKSQYIRAVVIVLAIFYGGAHGIPRSLINITGMHIY